MVVSTVSQQVFSCGSPQQEVKLTFEALQLITDSPPRGSPRYQPLPLQRCFVCTGIPLALLDLLSTALRPQPQHDCFSLHCQVMGMVPSALMKERLLASDFSS